MKQLLISFLMLSLGLVSPSPIASEEIRIPVIPFDKNRSSYFESHIYKKCKSSSKYSNCINRISKKENY